jgi:hypothetical protein
LVEAVSVQCAPGGLARDHPDLAHARARLDEDRHDALVVEGGWHHGLQLWPRL